MSSETGTLADNKEVSLKNICEARYTWNTGFVVDVVSRFCTSPIFQKLSDNWAASMSFSTATTPRSRIRRISVANADSGEELYLPVSTESTYHFWTMRLIPATGTSLDFWRMRKTVYAKSMAITELTSFLEMKPAERRVIINCVKLCWLMTFSTPSYIDL